MNRKISTLFTAGLLMAGALCSSAWAQQYSLEKLLGLTDAATELKSGTKYVITNQEEVAYGFTELNATTKTLTEDVKKIDNNFITDANKDVVKAYVWTVSETKSVRNEYSYTFKNEQTGELLRIKSDGSGVELVTSAKTDNVNFVFGANSQATVKYAATLTPAAFPNMFAYQATNNLVLSWDASASKVEATGTFTPKFFEVGYEAFTDAKELNALYNESGFAFATSKAVEENLFDQKIVARYLDAPINVDLGDKSIPSYVKMTIPAGMYFFVGEAPASNTTYQAWFDKTVIAVSSTQTVEATNVDRAAGQGFELVAMQVKDFNFYTETDPSKIETKWQSQGTETSIHNACFTVNKNYLSGDPYALSLEAFRYKSATSSTAHKELANMRLGILEHGDKNYLATKPNNTPIFVFSFSDSMAKNGIDLLNKEAVAAVYNIRVLGGEKGVVETLYGKYLTSSNGSESTPEFIWTAKAETLVDTSFPIFQFVITEVNGKNVTFTNRETQEYFTTKLFPVAGEENVYELGVSDNSIDDMIVPIYVNRNTYNETAAVANWEPLNKMKIKLEKVAEVDAFAGFLNVDNETLVTMAFARDSYETSNKFYAATDERNSNIVLNAYNEFATDLSGAAQWQLIKSVVPMKVVERSFVYNANNHVTVKAKADVAQAYTYKLQYIFDGQETGLGFPADNIYNAGSYVGNLSILDNLNAAPSFVIKKNVDGSVYLMEATGLGTTATKASVFEANDKSVVAAWSYFNGKKYETGYDIPRTVYGMPYTGNNDLELRTYLLSESPEISYPAKEGFVTFRGELSDYMTMNDNREGILVNSEPAGFYLHVTDKKAILPSFYISREGSFLFHPQDSVNYYVADGKYDTKYQWAENLTKALFKPATIDESRDTLTTNIKGEMREIAVKADDVNTLGGLNRFKVQIVLADDTDDMYVVRSLTSNGNAYRYLYAVNDKLTWAPFKSQALKFSITEGSPVSNESVADSATGVKIDGGNGVVEIQGAAGKKVLISNILGKVIVETVLTSDNATIAVPAGIMAVAVDGENVVKTIIK